ncbi:MAG: response regulator [Candidatus Hydrogenedens sp.]|nr:response regulator [Candidatus Hydrogenedens sp.]
MPDTPSYGNSPQSATESPHQLKPPKVIVADGRADFRTLMVRLIRGWDYEVLECADGIAASELLAARTSPCIALIDWLLPDCDGLCLCRKVQDDGKPLVYAIIVTSRTARSDLLENLDAGANAFLKMPFDTLELRTHLAVGTRLIAYQQRLEERNEEMRRFASNMEELASARADQLVHAERMVTIGTLTAGITHEINNAMGVISTNAQLLAHLWPRAQTWLSRHAADDPQAGMLANEMPPAIESIRKGVVRVTNIVKGLREFSRASSDQPRICSVNEVVEETLGLAMGATKRLTRVDLQLDARNPKAAAVQQQLVQVVLNLVVNACHAMEGQPESVLVLRTGIEGSHVMLRVEDTGPGIPDADLGKIWDAFFTTKECGKGTGLGLAISRELVQRMGGSIFATNRDEGGACFVISLPQANGEPGT